MQSICGIRVKVQPPRMLQYWIIPKPGYYFELYARQPLLLYGSDGRKSNIAEANNVLSNDLNSDHNIISISGGT